MQMPCFQHDSFKVDCGDCRSMNEDDDEEAVRELREELEALKRKIAAGVIAPAPPSALVPDVTGIEEEIEKVALAIKNITGGEGYDYMDFCRDAARTALVVSDRYVLARKIAGADIAKLAEQCAVACRREQFPSTGTFETRIEEVLRAALIPLADEPDAQPTPVSDPISNKGER